MRITLAIGDTSVEKWITKRVGEKYEFFPACGYRQKVLPAMRAQTPDILILSEALTGREGEMGIAILDLIEKVRTEFPKVRIIFIANEHDYESPEDTLLDAVAKMGIYDILCANMRKGESLMIADAVTMIEKPSDYSYASKFMHKHKDDRRCLESTTETAMIEIVPVAKKTRLLEKNENKNDKEIDSEPEHVIENESELEIIEPDKEKKEVEITEKNENDEKVMIGDTTVLTTNPNCLIFRQAMKEDFTTVFDFGTLPSPNELTNIAGSNYYERKNVLYNNMGGNVISRARITMFTGIQSGVGVTTTAVNVAVGLATHGKKVLYIDLSNTGISIYDRLGISVEKIMEKGKSDNEKGNIKPVVITKNFLSTQIKDADRLSKLPESLHYTLVRDNSEDGGKKVIKELAKWYDEIIIDSKNTDLLKLADEVVLITTTDIAVTNKLIKSLKIYQDMNYYKVVINRYVKTIIDIDYLASTLGISGKDIYTIRDNTKLYSKAACEWLPVYIASGKLVRSAYDRLFAARL